jgi:hypothetical protein
MALLITPINCSDSSLSIKESLPCDFSCSSGQFLTFDEDTESLKCSLCPEGTYSIGGGVEYNNWNNFKENFHSYCWVLFEEGWEMNEECLGWHSNSDTLLVTGTAPQKLWYEADLIFYPVLVKDGYLELNYRKETTSIEGLEIGDFYIFVDENLAHFDYSVDDYDWKNVKLPLSSGVHKINVVFAKFVTTSTSEAQIRDIQVRGTKFSDYSCKKCEVGHSPIGADSCLLCEVGSYLDIEEKICKKCPEGSISYPGALRVDSCFDAPVCQEIDWHFYYSPCEAGKQKKVFEWNSPMICDPVPVFLPNDEEVNCLPCGAGKVYLEGKCQPCPTGTFTTSGNFGDSCKVCPAGKYAPKVADFHEWTTFPLEFQSLCIHADRVECSYDWETRGTFIVSSPIYEVGSKVILQSNFEITEKNASLFFTFKVSGPATKFQFVVNGKKVFEKIGFGEGSEKFLLKVGENSFKWICEHFQKDVESCEISRIVVDGCVNGGAQYCLDCPNGLISEEGSDSCERCEVGMTSNGNHTKCVDCPERSFMDVNGICKDCPEGLNASTHHKSCVLSSEMLRIENETYVLKNFSGTPGESPFYCSEQKLQMFCYGTFYGPAQGDDHYFYISVLNPSQIYMPSYTQLSKSSGYAFGIINYAALGLDYFNLNKPGDGCNITSSKVVANLGSEISVLQNDKDYGSGFKVRYSEGDRCTNSSRFSTLIHFACNKEDEEGWPILLKYEDCEFHFYWPTVHACHVCTESTVIVHNSTCQDGKKTVHTFESSSCIFENRINYIEKIENCNYSQVYKTWPFILSLLLSGIMLFVVTLTIILACKKRSGYKKLIQYRMEGKNVELQVNK